MTYTKEEIEQHIKHLEKEIQEQKNQVEWRYVEETIGYGKTWIHVKPFCACCGRPL